MRNISCFLTTQQVRDRTKTVTRRLGWGNAKPGELLRVVVKSQGLKPGEKIEPLAIVELVSVRRVLLWDITDEECRLEGFPDFTPTQFIQMFSEHMGIQQDDHEFFVNRLEWKYREDLFQNLTTKE